MKIAAKKLKKIIKEVNPEDDLSREYYESGFHLCSFKEDFPEVRHIFCRLSQDRIPLVINEDSNKEEYDDFGRRTIFEPLRRYFFLINGGGNHLGHALINEQHLTLAEASFSEVVKIAKKIFSNVFEHNDFREVCGDGIDYVTITPSKIGETEYDPVAPKPLPVEKEKYYAKKISEHVDSLPSSVPPSGLKTDI
mgnify:CR=1 FL=1